MFKIDGFVARLRGPAAREPSSCESIMSTIELGFNGRGMFARSVSAKSREYLPSLSMTRLVYWFGNTVVASSHILPTFASSSFSGGGRISSNSEDQEVVEDRASKSFSSSVIFVTREDFSEFHDSTCFLRFSFSVVSCKICY